MELLVLLRLLSITDYMFHAAADAEEESIIVNFEVRVRKRVCKLSRSIAIIARIAIIVIIAIAITLRRRRNNRPSWLQALCP